MDVKLDKNRIPISTIGETKTYFDSDEEYADIVSIPRILKEPSNEWSDIHLTPEADRIFTFIDSNNHMSTSDNPNIKIMESIATKEYPYLKYINAPGSRIETVNGYQFLRLPPETKTYKATEWFYDSLPDNNKQIYIGNLPIAMRFMRMYHGGLFVYNFKHEVKLFICNVENLTKLHKETKDSRCRDAITKLFGIGEDEKLHIKKFGEMMPGDDPFPVYNHVINCFDPMKLPLAHGSKFARIQQDYLTEYLEREMPDVDGMFYPEILTYTNFECRTEEMSMKPSSLVIDKKDPLYWKNWGLDESRLMLDKFKLREKWFAYNKNHKVTDFYLDTNLDFKPINNNLRILTYNVHYLISGNAFDSTEDTYKKLVSFIKKVNPDVLILQEMNVKYALRLKKDCGFAKCEYTANGKFDNSMVVAAYTKHWSKMQQVTNHNITHRNFIIINYFGYKIVGCHLEIGHVYIARAKTIDKRNFQEAHDKNVAMRKDTLDKIDSYKPDIILGDMNFMPDDLEHQYMKSLGYSYDDNDEPTTIHKNKVDFAFSKIPVNTQVIKYSESDHRPLLAQIPFMKKSNNSIHGGDESTDNVFIICIILLIVLLFDHLNLLNEQVLLCILLTFVIYNIILRIKIND